MCAHRLSTVLNNDLEINQNCVDFPIIIAAPFQLRSFRPSIWSWCGHRAIKNDHVRSTVNRPWTRLFGLVPRIFQFESFGDPSLKFALSLFLHSNYFLIVCPLFVLSNSLPSNFWMFHRQSKIVLRTFG